MLQEEQVKKNPLCQLLDIEYPIIQAGMAWVSNAELAAAVSEAGGLGLVTPNAGMPAGGNIRENLRQQIRLARSYTSQPIGVAMFLGYVEAESLLHIAVEEGVHIVVTSGGSPALHTGFLKENDVTVLHLVASVRHARAAEAHGVDAVIAEGVEAGGWRGVNEIPTMALVPQIVEAVDLPVVASGGITDSRGFAAALCLGAVGVYMGTRFVATTECAAHQRYKEALVKALDTDTVVVYHNNIPVRLLRTEAAVGLQDAATAGSAEGPTWTDEAQYEWVRSTYLDGDVKGGLAYCGAGVGMINEIMSAGDVVRSLIENTRNILTRVTASV